jgi:hypothetical protein
VDDGRHTQAIAYATTVGVAAGAGALLPAIIAASAAASHRPDALSLQRALVTIRDGLGGPWIDPAIQRLIPAFLIAYAAAALSWVATLAFCWYAGYLAAALGAPRSAPKAGRRVALLSWTVWAVAMLFAVLVLRDDGTLSWVAATLAKLRFTPTGQPITGMSVAAPDAAFVLVQLAVLLLHLAAGLALGLYFGGLAAESGAASGVPFILSGRKQPRGRLQPPPA